MAPADPTPRAPHSLERRSFLAMIAGGLLATPLAAGAQQPGKVFRIGFLGGVPFTDPEAARLWEAFIQGLRELGYVEGQNIAIERRAAEGKSEQFAALAADLVRLKVDVIVVAPSPSLAAKEATRTIPIVMMGASDPVGLGLVASLARPGGNVTGLSQQSPEIVGKQLEMLKGIAPRISRVAVLSNPTNRTAPLMLGEAQVAARSLRVQLQTLEVRGADDYERAFAAMTKERAGALLVLNDPMFYVHRARIADLAAKSRLPTVFGLTVFVDAGGLLSYGASLPDLSRRAATYVGKILKGAKPGDLPVEQPSKFELAINAKTARALGLTIPVPLLQRADVLIQ